jgi:ectoine hydroxylase-related dioxygenase (phytanoyl-CoA dioxygenase family)
MAQGAHSKMPGIEVALHQDLSIPVERRIESAECSGWSEKEGCLYVQPPAEVLEEMVAVRVHVDACPAESGALRVVPGSHMFGRLDSVAAKKLKEERGEVVVPVPRGGALVMKPLLLHASSKATGTMPRRVLHFVFGPPELPFVRGDETK